MHAGVTTPSFDTTSIAPSIARGQTDTRPLQEHLPKEDAYSPTGVSVQKAANLLNHASSSCTVPSEAMLQSIVDECCAAAAASGLLHSITEYSSSEGPGDDNNKDFLSQCAALSEALSRTSDSGRLSASRRSHSRRLDASASGSLPRPQSRNAVSGSLSVATSAAVRDTTRSRTRTR